MQVEVTLAELIIDAIGQGKIRGVQFSRKAVTTEEIFDDLQRVISNRLENARSVAIEQALERAYHEQPVLALKRRCEAAEARVRELEGR